MTDYQLFSYIYLENLSLTLLFPLATAPPLPSPFPDRELQLSPPPPPLPLPPGFYSAIPLSNTSLPSLHYLLLQRRHFTFLISFSVAQLICFFSSFGFWDITFFLFYSMTTFLGSFSFICHLTVVVSQG